MIKVKEVKFEDVKPYETTGHSGAYALRLHHKDLTDSENFWVGLSYFFPGGGAEMSSTNFEKVYVVLSGRMTVIDKDGKEITLGPKDSIRIEPDEKRELKNKFNEVVSMLVISAYPKN